MNFYLVSYDLRAPGQKYEDLITEIKKSPTQRWAKPLESLFLIATNESVQQAYDRFKKKMDANDFILVMKICQPHQGWFDEKDHEWINNNVPWCG